MKTHSRRKHFLFHKRTHSIREHTLHENTSQKRTLSIPWENTFYKRPLPIRKHCPWENTRTISTREHFLCRHLTSICRIQKHFLYEITFCTRTHSVREHISYRLRQILVSAAFRYQYLPHSRPLRFRIRVWCLGMMWQEALSCVTGPWCICIAAFAF